MNNEQNNQEATEPKESQKAQQDALLDNSALDLERIRIEISYHALQTSGLVLRSLLTKTKGVEGLADYVEQAIITLGDVLRAHGFKV